MFWRGVAVGFLLWFFLPIGLIALLMLVRRALRDHGEAPRGAAQIEGATYIAGGIAEPRRPRDREAWTKIKDYVGG